MILLVGYANESTMNHFIEYTEAHHKKETAVLDLGTLATATKVEVESIKGGLRINIDGNWTDLSDYDAIYTRAFYLESGTAGRGELYSQVLSYVNAYLSECDALVVNRPSAGTMNGNKLLHLIELKKAGFNVPYAVFSSCSKFVEKSIHTNGTWVSKSCSSIKTRAVEVTSTLLADISRIQYAPSQFQNRICGYDVRVHVVGSQIVGIKIESQILDYRFERLASDPNKFNEIEIPHEISKLCYKFCRNEGLEFAGFDFKVSEADGLWYVLEANPMPGYDYFDRKLDSKISRCLFQLLYSGQRLPQPQPVVAPFIDHERRPIIKIS